MKVSDTYVTGRGVTTRHERLQTETHYETSGRNRCNL